MNSSINILEKTWWIFLVRGIVAIVFAIAAFAWPAPTIAILVLIAGTYLFVDGVVGIVNSIRYRDQVEGWWWWLLESALGLVLGVLMFAMPGLTAYALVLIVAFWAIFGGIFRIVAAIQFRRHVDGGWLLGLGGALSILFGVLLYMMPGAGIVSLAWLIGVWAGAFGALYIALAARLRNAAKKMRTHSWAT